MAYHHYTSYGLVDNPKNLTKVSSSESEFDDFLRRHCGVVSQLFSISSRRAYTRYSISLLVEAIHNTGALSFITDAEMDVTHFYLIPSIAHKKIVSDINSLILWCKQYPNEAGNILGGGYNPEEISEIIDDTEFIPYSFADWLECDGPIFLIEYLKVLLQVFKQAESTQQSLVYTSRIM